MGRGSRKLLPSKNGPNDRWYFMNNLIAETIKVGIPVLERYGTLPIILQALLELSATVTDRWGRHGYTPTLALEQIGWTNKNDLNEPGNIIIDCMKKTRNKCVLSSSLFAMYQEERKRRKNKRKDSSCGDIIVLNNPNELEHYCRQHTDH